MTTLDSPTREQAAMFLDNMKASILDAIDRGSHVQLCQEPFVKPISYDDECDRLMDYLVTGGRWVVSVGKDEL